MLSRLIFSLGYPLTKEIVPFSVQEVLVEVGPSDANIILAVSDLLDLDVPGTFGYDDYLPVSGTLVFVVRASDGYALGAVAVAYSALVLRGVRVHGPIASDLLRVYNCY